MNSPWVKLLLIALLFGIGGFLLGRYCSCWGDGGCGRQAGCHHAEASCGHGGASCHAGGGSCCRGGHGEGHGAAACCKGKASGEHRGHGMHGGHGDDQAHVIIQDLERKNFQGDTTISIEGGTVNVKRTGEKMEVKVEMRDSSRAETTVVVH